MKTLTKKEAFDGLKEYFKDDLQASTFLKYVLQDKYDNYYESNPNQTFRRIAKEIARVESKWPNAMKEDEIFLYLEDFNKIVFQGSPMMGIGNNFIYSSLSNCVVIDSPKDNISSIIDSAKELANLTKRRAGVGLDLSELRPEGTPVNNSARTSTGAWSFAELYSDVIKKIGQCGRRGALLETMDIRHPDILKLAKAKAVEGKIDRANISIKMTNKFFEAIKQNRKFIQRWPVDSDKPIVVQEIDANELFDVIVDYATKTGDPGLIFFDTVCENLPSHVYPQFKTICCNACSELPLPAYSSCRLISQNLTSYVKKPFTKEATFDWQSLHNDTVVAQRFADDLVELEIEKLEQLIEIVDVEDEIELYKKLLNDCKQGRRTGVGTHGIADVFIMMGMIYGDEQSIDLAEKIYETRMNASYQSSAILAEERGPFPAYNKILEKGHRFLNRLNKATKKLIEKYGRRNIANLTNAPTGSLAIVSGTSAGIDPNFSIRDSFRKKRKNHDDEKKSIDYIDDSGDVWEVYEVIAPIVKRWIKHGNTLENIPDYFIESNDVNIEGRLKLQSVIQKYIDHSIATTFNLPKGTDKSIVKDVYMKAWEYGLKGVTVFVDGCKDGVLERANPVFKPTKAPKRPKTLSCDIHNTTIKKEKWTIIVGLLGGKPYEIFGGLSKYVELPKKTISGKIHKTCYKTRSAIYDLELDNELLIKDIGSTFNNDLYEVHTRMVSLGLRHGAKPSFIVEQLQKDKSDSDLTSFSKVLGRVLKKYIDNGTKVTSEKICLECKNESLIYQDGCVICISCGYSKCN